MVVQCRRTFIQKEIIGFSLVWSSQNVSESILYMRMHKHATVSQQTYNVEVHLRKNQTCKQGDFKSSTCKRLITQKYVYERTKRVTVMSLGYKKVFNSSLIVTHSERGGQGF